MFARPAEGLRWTCECPHLPFSGSPAWQSQGSIGRTLPTVLNVEAFAQAAPARKVSLLGIFALDAEAESFGAVGAIIQVWEGNNLLTTVELVSGRHYLSATESSLPLRRSCGDGTGLETMGTTSTGERVDLFSIDLGNEARPTHLVFRDLGTPASFVIFDVFWHYESTPACPFRGRDGSVSLKELGSIVRVGDRLRLARAVEQLRRGLLSAEDLDEARGEALTFIAIVTAATLETGGSRAMHRVQLDAARKLETLGTREAIAEEAKRVVERVAENLAVTQTSPSQHLIDRALAIVNRNFAREISDEEIARELALSTSHFRHLFKEATGQPFHRYTVALRLEQARKLLLEHDLPVTEAAVSVGFSSLAHFSRAFNQRFGVTPSAVRRLSKPNAP